MTDVREALARLVRTLDAKSAEDQERLGRYWDRGLADGDVQENVYRRTDAILAEFDVVPRGERVKPPEEDQWWESLVEAPCDQGHRVFIDDGDGGVYACPVCRLSGERVKPSVEDVDFTEVANLAQEMLGKGVWPDTARAVFEAVLALYPGRAGETEWEYNIAYPVAEGDATWWETDGVDPFDTFAEARSELDGGEYLDSDRVVRRRKSGKWGEVPSE